MMAATITTPAASTARVVALRRKDGKIAQGCDIYIGRALTMGGWKLPASPFANPFTIKECKTAEIAVKKYEDYIRGRQDLLKLLPTLKGKVLGCWCKKPSTPNAVCHGDVLIKLLKEQKIE
jgi:hypothetical protein